MSSYGFSSNYSSYPGYTQTTQDTYYSQPQYPQKGYEYDNETITQEDCWHVVAAYFQDKTLVTQQLASFDEFVHNTMQELVDENASLVLDQGMQHTGRSGDVTRRYEINFGQIYLSKPTMTEADGSVQLLYPNEARLRNLTYSAPLYVDIRKRVLIAKSNEPGPDGDYEWELDKEETARESAEDGASKVYVGKVPIMLRSDFCTLSELDDDSLYELNECPYDKGGYFVINGSEKVLIAQERMAANHVYVFAKAAPSPVSYLSEIRSAVEKGGKTIS
ncbi:hypothetical protein BT69DRAFT_1254363, partial [Atractiella rhizophila]